MPDRALRVGILGPGHIVERALKDFHLAEGLTLAAVGSRDLSRAQQAARRYGCAHAFGSYEQLAACDDVDLVYIATPHNFHVRHAILCMEHGKHVLCEKPLALNEHEIQRMVECARKHDVFLMEGMWSRFFPAMRKAAQLVRGGAIGEVVHVASDFCFHTDFDPDSRLFSRELAGGALLDVGIYPMAATSLFLGAEPVHLRGYCKKAPTGVDAFATALLQYKDGQTAMQTSGVCANSSHMLTILGDKGRIEVPDFWHATRLVMTDNGGQQTTLEFPPEDEGFRHEFIHVRECIQAGLRESPIMPLGESLALSRMMSLLRRDWGIRYPEEA